MRSESSSRTLVCRRFCFALGDEGPDPRRLFQCPQLRQRHHWGQHPTLHVQCFRGGQGACWPRPRPSAACLRVPPDPPQDAASPLLGPCGPTSGEQANREAGLAHSTESTPQESVSAHGELRAQPRKHPTLCPPPGCPPDPTPKPPARPLPGSRTPAESTGTQAGKTCRRRV